MAVRRHWPWLTAIPIIIVSVLITLVQPGDKSRVKAQVASPEATTQPTADRAQSEAAKALYRRAQHLRTELCLTNRDLAALGLSAASAQQVLEAIKSVASSGPDPLADVVAAEQLAKRNLAQAVRKVNVGPRDESTLNSLASLKQSVGAVKAQKAAALSGLVDQINGMLTPDQQAMWQATRANAGKSVPGAYRCVTGLTDGQIQQLELAARRGGAPGLTATAPQILNATQAAQAQMAQDNQRVSSARVAVAENQVLPLPESLKPKLQPATLPAR